MAQIEKISALFRYFNGFEFFSSKAGNKLYRNLFKNNMQTCQVIKNSPVRDGVCLARHTVSQESVRVGVRAFATIWQMSISRFS